MTAVPAGPTSGSLHGAISLQSSSPSYLLMASLDAARAAAAAPGAFDEALAAAAAAREAAGQIAGLQVLSAGRNAEPHRPTLDPLKLTIGVNALGISGRRAVAATVSERCLPEVSEALYYHWHSRIMSSLIRLLTDGVVGCTGYQAAEWLAEQGIATELATYGLVLAAFGAGSTMQDASRLAAALKGLCQSFSGTLEPAAQLPSTDAPVPVCSALPVAAMLPRDVQFAAVERWVQHVCIRVHHPVYAPETTSTGHNVQSSPNVSAKHQECTVQGTLGSGCRQNFRRVAVPLSTRHPGGCARRGPHSCSTCRAQTSAAGRRHGDGGSRLRTAIDQRGQH
jgi:hypothetical protein